MLTVPGRFNHKISYRAGDRSPIQLRLYRRPGRFRFALSNDRGDATQGFILALLKPGSGGVSTIDMDVQDASGTTSHLLGEMVSFVDPAIPAGDSATAIETAMLSLAEDRRTSGADSVPGDQYAPLLARIRALDVDADRRLGLQVLLDTLFRVNHVRALARQRKLRASADQRPEFASQMAYHDALLAQIAAPEFLSPHGYRLPIAALPLEEVTAELGALMEALAGEGMATWLTYGALLGHERQGSLLPHDDDIDLNIRIPGATEDEVVATWKTMMARIKSAHGGHQKNGFVAVELPCGIEVDLFPCWVADGVVSAYPHVQGEFGDEVFFPLVKKAWAGTEIYFPAQTDRVLAQAYGENWRVPDPYWKFDWKRAHGRFATFLAKTRT